MKGSGNFTNMGRNPILQNNSGELIHKNIDERSYTANLEYVHEKIIEESQ